MRRLLAPSLAAVLFLAAPSFAASGLDAARATATSARAKVNEIRGKQMELRMELNRVATRIEELKTTQKGSLIPGSELETSLQRSQELSGTLTEMAQAFSSAEAQLEQQNLVFLNALNQELDALRAQWDRLSDRAARQNVINKMRALRLERDSVRAMLPASKVPALGGARSDDPEDLLEQADALRDSEDKVRQKMKALQARVTELREERDLDRRMSDFMGDEAMFDDQDRRLRRQRTTDMAQEKSPPLFGGMPAQDAASAPAAGSGMESSNDPGTTTGERTDTTQQPPPVSEPKPVVITQIARGVDARPQVAGSVDSLLLQSGAGDDLESLEAQLKKLKQLANELDERADDMEKRANELE